MGEIYERLIEITPQIKKNPISLPIMQEPTRSLMALF